MRSIFLNRERAERVVEGGGNVGGAAAPLLAFPLPAVALAFAAGRGLGVLLFLALGLISSSLSSSSSSSSSDSTTVLGFLVARFCFFPRRLHSSFPTSWLAPIPSSPRSSGEGTRDERRFFVLGRGVGDLRPIVEPGVVARREERKVTAARSSSLVGLPCHTSHISFLSPPQAPLEGNSRRAFAPC